MHRCGEVPMPGVPYERAPGFCLASAISSATVLTGTAGLTTRMLGAVAVSVIGTKSRTGS